MTCTGRSLVYVFLYGSVIIYIYSLIGFAEYREIYIDRTGHYCRTFYECFVTTLRRGLLTGIYDVSPHFELCNLLEF